MPLRGLLLFLLASMSARAQDAPIGAPDVAPPAPEALPEALGTRLVWELRTPLRGGARPVGIAVQPAVAGAWLVVDEQGGVWRSDDVAGSWTRVLSPRGDAPEEGLPDDEELLLEAESRREETRVEVELESEGASVPDAEGLEDTEEVEVETEVEADEGGLEDAGTLTEDFTRRDAEGAAAPFVWFAPDAPDRAFVGRADGLWLSTDAGESWEQVSVTSVDNPQITTLHRGADGALIAGSVDGVRFSVDDGRSWIDAEDATDGAHVFAIVEEDASLWAATSRGLYRSTNGLSWVDVPLPDSGSVRAIVRDEAWDRGFWVATTSALLRTDDGGNSFYVAGRQPLRGLRDMVSLDDPGHLLAISDDGVWESTDGGVAWNTANRQLVDPDVRAVALSDAGVVIVTPRGVWRFVEPRALERVSRIREKSLSLPDTIDAAVSRGGLKLDLVSLARIGLMAPLVPNFELTFDYDAPRGRTVDYTASTTTDTFDSNWALQARFCWGNCSGTVVVDYDGSTSETLVEDELYVFDGEVFEEGEPVAAAANVAQRVRSYRRYLAEHVSDAWLSRTRLVAETATVRNQPLREQVLHALQIQELDARLDALTEGQFSRSITRTEESP